MAAIDYPDEILPNPLVQSTKVNEGPRVLRTKMDSGYRVMRKRFTKVPAFFSFQLLLDTDSLSFFQAWFSDTLDSGINFFNMDLPVGDSLVSPHECRFSEEPQYILNGHLWTVNLKVEAIEMNLGIDYDEVMEGVIETFDGVRGFKVTGTYLDKFDVFVNTRWPAMAYT